MRFVCVRGLVCCCWLAGQALFFLLPLREAAAAVVNFARATCKRSAGPHSLGSTPASCITHMQLTAEGHLGIFWASRQLVALLNRQSATLVLMPAGSGSALASSVAGPVTGSSGAPDFSRPSQGGKVAWLPLKTSSQEENGNGGPNPTITPLQALGSGSPRVVSRTGSHAQVDLESVRVSGPSRTTSLSGAASKVLPDVADGELESGRSSRLTGGGPSLPQRTSLVRPVVIVVQEAESHLSHSIKLHDSACIW